MSTKALPLPSLPPMAPLPLPRLVEHRRPTEVSPPIGVVAAATLTIWVFCLVVGVLGLLLHYPVAHLPAVDVPVTAKIVHVDLTDDAPPPDATPAAATSDPPDNPEPPPAVPEVATPPAAPPLQAVAVPSPAIAFALPVKGPSQVTDAKHAVPTAHQPAETPAPNVATAVRHLTFGQGEGAQPKPEYPREAAMAGEQGVVTVRFTVGETGNVISAEVASSCRWPMLNQAALRAVRDHWHFDPGERRLFEISIHFQLNEKEQ